jgi:DNA-binding NarL/FixJ family response regulator
MTAQMDTVRRDEEPPPARTPNVRPRVRVLLVDDDPVVIRRLGKMLVPLGFEIVASTNDGQHAVELARLLSPDIALIDWDMPRFGGALTAHLIDTHVPDVIPTLLLEHDDLAEARGGRVARWFSTVDKFSDAAEMQARLTAILHQRRGIRRLSAAIRQRERRKALGDARTDAPC